MKAAVIFALTVMLGDCQRHDVEIEPPAVGRALSRKEQAAIQTIADAAFHDVRSNLDGLPPKLTLIVRWGKDVIPETGETAAAGYPGNIGWTVDPDRDVLTTIKTQLRPSLFHELHHLARASRVKPVTLLDRVIDEGLATAFERDYAKVPVPWGEPPPEPWIAEVLALPPSAPFDAWLHRLPDGRRWVGMRVGTALVDRATKATGKTSAALVFTPAGEIVQAATR